VIKKDKSWRIFVDYKELNKNTMKNKFLIPLVDDLQGFAIFSKIDLRFGYNLVRIDTTNLYETSFRTNGRNY